ncbi:MAG: HEAT repeat domain-containing protein [Candidatus Cloacimonetes bacterium]|nr:HEAT repeat domain-containing protein [Candidatus Cloacimonadota bacterium]
MKISRFILPVGLSLALSGCSGGPSPFSEELYQAEEHLVRLELDQARKVLAGIRQSSNELPERYYQNSIRVHLAAFEFQQSLAELKRWQQATGVQRPKERTKILLAWLRHFSEYTDLSIRFEALKALGEMRDQSSKDILMQNFEYPSRTVRIVVCYAMALLGDKERALTYLMERARYGSLKQRALSALFLAELKDVALIPVYRSFLEDPENSIRSIGATVLADLRATEAKSALTKILKETLDPRMKMTMAHALVRLGDDQYMRIIEELRNNHLFKLDAELLLYDLGRTGLEDSVLARLDELDAESRFVFMRSMIRHGRQDKVRELLSEKLGSLTGTAFEKKMELELMALVGTAEDLDKLEVHMSSPFEEVKVVAVKTWWQIQERLNSSREAI